MGFLPFVGQLALGAGLVVPGPHQAPLAIATITLNGLRQMRERKKLARAASMGLMDPPSEVTLEWSQLTCTLKPRGKDVDKDAPPRLLLSNVEGAARPGRLTALMGPSGSGKTTLLNALAGQMPATPGMELRGVITLNGAPSAGAGARRAGFVQQDDLFFSQMTVRETLSMAAELRLPKGTTPAERAAAVEAVITRLGLAKAADTPVGDAKTRGLSGGEKKRLSIALELLARPALVFADEPTSGLDGFAAQKVMEALKELTTDGHTVVASIHQPRSSVFALFDDLILLSEGQLVYAGPAADVLPYFARLGHPCPPNFNPADFLSDLIAIDHSSPEAEAECRARLSSLVSAWRRVQYDASRARLAEAAAALPPPGVAPEPRPPIGLGRQFRLLFGRSLRQVTRDKATNIGRAMSQISSAIVFGMIYWRMGRSQSSIQDRLGLLQVSAVGTAMTSLIKTLNVFPTERALISRERSRAGYQVLPYLLSKLAAELPVGALFPALFAAITYPTTGLNPSPVRFARFAGILALEAVSAQALGLAVGAAAPSTSAALAIGPAVILVSIVFGGLFVNADNVPKALSWLPAASLIKQSFEGCCVNEFTGETFEPDAHGRGTTDGEAVLERMSFGGSSVRKTLANQGRITLIYWWCTLCILRARRPQYQRLLPPLPAKAAQPAGA